MSKYYFDNPEVESKAAAVYKDGFNIYMYIGRLKKDLSRKSFPDQIIMAFCDAYWKSKPAAKNQYPYFLKTFKMVSAEYFANQQQADHARHKAERSPVAQSVKDVLKGMFS